MSRTAFFRKALLAVDIFFILPSMLPAQGPTAEKTVSAAPAPEVSTYDESGPLLRATFSGCKSWKRVEQGTVLEGRLSLPLYAEEQIVAPADSTVRITVSSVEKIHDNIGSWRKTSRAMVRVFNPLETNHPTEYRVEVGAAELLQPTGEVLPLDVRVLRASSGVMVQPNTTSLQMAGAGREKSKAGNILLMALRREAFSSVAAERRLVPVGTTREQRVARAYLLTVLRASQNHQGDTFRAQLAEPAHIGGRVFATGSVVEGTVVRRVPPRMLSRAGKLYLRVDRIVPVEGEPLRVGGSLSAAEADSQSRFALDEEGTLHGRKPGIMNGVVDASYAYFVGKVSDDIAETPIRAIGAAMSDAAVVNAARYVGLGSSVAFLITRHGRDVYLPKYALIEIDFGRVSQNAAVANHD